MTALAKAAAMQLVADIKRAKVSGHAMAHRLGRADKWDGDHVAMGGFLGGLEIVLQHFLRMHGCPEAADALPAAMNYVPSAAEIEARNAEIQNLGKRKA